jgi:hypothetical protein
MARRYFRLKPKSEQARHDFHLRGLKLNDGDVLG